MEVEINERKVRLCDLCFENNSTKAPNRNCITCHKDICEDHVWGNKASYSDSARDWIPYEAQSKDGVSICTECFTYFEKHKYKKISKWGDQNAPEAFKTLYSKMINKALKDVQKKMETLLTEEFGTLKTIYDDEILKQKHIEELVQKKRDLDAKARKLQEAIDKESKC